MTYAVKEIFYTLQGEGANTGRAAVFCRFAGCNLWSGREADRAAAICQFCDTDFVGTDGTLGGKYPTADALADTVAAQWPAAATGGRPLVVCTGGEPLLQLDRPLIDALHARGFEIAIETNGTLAVPDGIDWVCVSPKMGAELVVTRGDEPQGGDPAAGPGPRRLRTAGFPAFLPAAHGWAAGAPEYGAGRRAVPASSALASVAANP